MAILFSACKKNKDPYPDHIIAGETSGQGVYYSGYMNEEFTHSSWSTYIQREIDINGDGTNECILKYFASNSQAMFTYQVSIGPAGHSYCAIAVADSGGSFAYPIPSNTIIDNNLKWYPGDCILYHYHSQMGTTSQAGLWKGVKGKYVGVTAMDGERTIYGWVRVELDGSLLKLFGYAGTGS